LPSRLQDGSQPYFVFIRAFVNTYRCRRPDFTFHEAAAVSDSQLVSTLSSHLSVVHSQTCNTIDRTPFCQVRDHDEGSCTPAGIRVAVKKAWLTKRDERRWEGTMNPGGTTMTTNVGGALRLMRTRAAVSHLRSTVHQTRHSLCSLDYALWILTVVSGTPFAPRAQALLRSPAVQLPTIHSRDP